MKIQAFGQPDGRVPAVWRIAVLTAAAATILTGTPRGASAQRVECQGPLRECIQNVGGWCEREPDGKIVAIYMDRPGTSTMLERCIGEVHEKYGKPNPYKPAPQKPAPAR